MSGYENHGAQTTYTVPLSKVIKELSLRPVYMPVDPEKLLISSREVNRPGLELNGFLDYFDSHRILIMGNTETAFLIIAFKIRLCFYRFSVYLLLAQGLPLVPGRALTFETRRR